jgi:DNA polymerase-4
LRYADFQTLERSRTLTATFSELELFPVVRELFRRARTRRKPIRLLGVRLSNLRPAERQLSLFAQGESLCRAIDGVRTRYGYDALRRALSESIEHE